MGDKDDAMTVALFAMAMSALAGLGLLIVVLPVLLGAPWWQAVGGATALVIVAVQTTRWFFR